MSKECSCHNHEEENENKVVEYILTLFGIILLLIAIFTKNEYFTISFACFVSSYLLIGYEVIINAFKKLFKRDMFDENFLMMIATFGAFAIGQYTEAVVVILLYKIGEILQDRAVENSKKKISETLDIRQKQANIEIDNKIEVIDVEKVNIGDVIIVKTGDKVPVDGVILSDEASIDMSALNGESKPVTLNKDQEILSGSVNIGSVFKMKVTKKYEDSTVSKIIKLIEEAESKKSHTEKFITRFAKVYTPIVTLIAVLIALLPLVINMSYTVALNRAFTFLVISCPCALVISVPLGFFVGIGAASKRGIIIKGSNYLDILTNVNTVVFDKTGTLTKGVFEVVKVKSYTDLNEDEIIENIALCESYSNHYIAKSILKYYGKEINNLDIIKHEEIAGKGIKVYTKEKEILVGNESLMKESNIKIIGVKEVGTIIYLTINEKLQGYIVLSDILKEDAKDLISKLKNIGIKKNIMLTGDSQDIAKTFANDIGIDEVYSNLLPEDKAGKLESIKGKEYVKRVAYLGDGINDSPVLALADVGISMGKGSDIAIETSDIVIMSDEPSKLVDAIKIAKKTKRIVNQNITFALLIKIVFLILSGFGMMSMWFAIFADTGVALLTVLNSIRIFNIKK